MSVAAVVPGEVVQLSPLVRRLTCNNPGIMTGPGTNTYLVGDPARRELVVIDPGPDDDAHLEAIIAAGPADAIRWIVVTHTHNDHSPLAPKLAARTGASVIGFDARDDFTPDVTAGDGYAVPTDEFTLRAIHTPGHASNHLCWLLDGERLLFSGDHVMSGSTVVIAPPDGDMVEYLAALERVRMMKVASIAPGHGPFITDPDAVLGDYISHRGAREQEILDALRVRGSATIEELVSDVYVGVADVLHPIAQFSVWAHLRKLAGERSVTGDDLGDMSAKFRFGSAPAAE